VYEQDSGHAAARRHTAEDETFSMWSRSRGNDSTPELCCAAYESTQRNLLGIQAATLPAAAAAPNTPPMP